MSLELDQPFFNSIITIMLIQWFVERDACNNLECKHPDEQSAEGSSFFGFFFNTLKSNYPRQATHGFGFNTKITLLSMEK